MGAEARRAGTPRGGLEEGGEGAPSAASASSLPFSSSSLSSSAAVAAPSLLVASVGVSQKLSSRGLSAPSKCPASHSYALRTSRTIGRGLSLPPSRSIASHCLGDSGAALAAGSVIGSEAVPPASEIRLGLNLSLSFGKRCSPRGEGSTLARIVSSSDLWAAAAATVFAAAEFLAPPPPSSASPSIFFSLSFRTQMRYSAATAAGAENCALSPCGAT